MSQTQWLLLKSSDREVHGPVDLDTLLGWASEAKISPLDRISRDNSQTWLRAPMIEELQMDWLIEMPDAYLYGPTNIGTIQEFLATGEINGSVTLINCQTGEESRLEDLPLFQVSPHQTRGADTTFVGTQYGMQTSADPQLLKRVQLLERQIVDYQRVVDQWQQAYDSLRQQFIEATGREPL
jgi:hypothetical protein